MTYRVDISIPALQDAENAFLWIRDFDLESAKNWYEGLLETIFSLEEFPARCSIAPESILFGRDIRQLIYGKGRQSYRIFFEVIETEKVVRIYRIWHSSRDWITKEEFDEGKPLAE
jgi:plasmid stabilization system protein ParE